MAVAFLRKSGGGALAVVGVLAGCAPGPGDRRPDVAVPFVLRFRRGGAGGDRSPCARPVEDHMAKIRALSIVVTLGLAPLATASPARAYVIEALTSIPADEAADKEALAQAIRAAVNDIGTHAVAFTPTMVSLRQAKLVGDRIYLFILLADSAGEAEIEVLQAASTPPGPEL